jgi:hypothetical protein
MRRAKYSLKVGNTIFETNDFDLFYSILTSSKYENKKEKTTSLKE